MPTYNGERFVAEALESVRHQDSAEIEVVVVDDGSSDRTVKIVRSFESSLPIRLILSPRTGNWVAATNLGLREARGDWACFLHQDDLWLTQRLATVHSEIQRANGPLILCDSSFVGPEGEGLGKWTCPLPAGDSSPEEFVGRLLVQNFIAIPSPVFLRSAAVESGGLDETLWFSADWDLWLRLGAMGPVRHLPHILTAFRIHRASQTMTRKLLPDEWEQQLTIVHRRHLERLRCSSRHRSLIHRVATASIAVNCFFAGFSRSEPIHIRALASSLIRLGPRGWHKYLRDSRIFQRVGSRLRLRYRRGF